MKLGVIRRFVILLLALVSFSTMAVAQDFSYQILANAYYRTCEQVEITGNEDTFGLAITASVQWTSEYWRFFLSGMLLQPLSSKARFSDFFASTSFSMGKSGFIIDLTPFSLTFLYAQNIVLNYSFENYYPAVVTSLPSYPLESSFNADIQKRLPYFPFLLGGRQLPLYYENAIYLYDCQFYASMNVDNWLLVDVGASNGEEGLDSNSSKAFIAKLELQSRNDETSFIFSLAALLGERGSVPIKVWCQQYSAYMQFEVGTFIAAFEMVFNLHGIKDPDINPYAVWTPGSLTYTLYQYYYGSGLFGPDDLPNLIDSVDPDTDRMPPLQGLGGFLYLAYAFPLFSADVTIFTHFSLYDPEIRNDDYTIYKMKYRLVSGISLSVADFTVLFSCTITYDEVFTEYGQFYDAEIRHAPYNYDLFASVILRI